MARRLAAHAITLAGLVVVVVAVYALVVLTFGDVPTSSEWKLILLSMLGAAVSALVYVPVRRRLAQLSAGLLGREERDVPAEVLRTFAGRLTLPLPLEELLLQLCESLRATLALDAAEVWTGTAGILERAAADPDVGPAGLVLTPAEQSVVARAGVRGPSWLSTWLPSLVAARGDNVRMAPITNSGELLGLIVIERDAATHAFTDDDEQVLDALARQVGLALRNFRLGSALDASMAELRRQADELRASRARVVAAGDAERRRIERDLHDGAQQHLVGMAAQLRVARDLAETDPARARAILEGLSAAVHNALEDFRDLAHGIYPPVLAMRGLRDGLRDACARASVAASVCADDVGRYPPEVEATVYFCCLEALQNVGKHAGKAARATVSLREDADGLSFAVIDDGVGFAADSQRPGTGLTNMGDRLGALGGRLSVTSAPGSGTRVAGAIPLERPATAQPDRRARPLPDGSPSAPTQSRAS